MLLKLTSSQSRRYWSKVTKTESCWVWAPGYHRYGTFYINKRVRTAHRTSYEMHFGEIPTGQCVCHKCDNPRCINPDHLFLGTQKQNLEDMRAKGRAAPGDITASPGESNGNSKLTQDQVNRIRELYKQGMTQLAIAKEFGVHNSLVSLIVHNKIWKQ